MDAPLQPLKADRACLRVEGDDLRRSRTDGRLRAERLERGGNRLETAPSSRCRAATTAARRHGRGPASPRRWRGCRRTWVRRRGSCRSGEGRPASPASGARGPAFHARSLGEHIKSRSPSIRRLTTSGRAGGGCHGLRSDPISEYLATDCEHIQPNANINQLALGISPGSAGPVSQVPTIRRSASYRYRARLSSSSSRTPRAIPCTRYGRGPNRR